MRLSYTRNGSGTEIIEENNFYPFGMNHEGYNVQTGNPSYNYQYNGKELQKETGWSDYGARMYMSDIGRWGVIDPLSETSRRFTPYNYALDNPIRFIDPDGRKAMAPETEVINYTGGNSLWAWLAGPGKKNHLDMKAVIDSQDGMGDFQSLIALRTGGGGSTTFGETQAYRDIMAQFYFPNINFSQFGDDITIGKDGRVKKVDPNGKPHRFFDESGIQLFFSDPKNVDKNSQNKEYHVGDQVYEPIDRNEFLNAIASMPNNNLIMSTLVKGRTGGFLAPTFLATAYGLIGYESTQGEADFSAHYLSRKLGLSGTNVNQNDSSYHFRFGNTNTIYSLMDAGNFMWGGWSKFIGLTALEVRGGINTYEVIYNGKIDTPADQRSVFSGIRFLTTGK